MLQMYEEGKEREEITFYFDLHKEKHLEYFRILGKTYTTQLDFHNLFQPQRKIGHGLTATVYKVTKNIDNSTVAVKAFKKSVYFATADGRGEVRIILPRNLSRDSSSFYSNANMKGFVA